MNKISIIGSGNVGATTALFVAEKNISDVVLVDIVEGVPQGKALDMLQTTPIKNIAVNIFGTNDFSQIADSKIVVVTAGFPRKPGMSRLDLLQKNAEVISSVTEKIKLYTPESIIIMVTNPLDVMTYLAYKTSEFHHTKVLGMAGVLDTARYRTFIAQELNICADEVHALILGCHGDDMLPLPKYTSVSGIPISELLSDDKLNSLIKRTRNGGAEIVSLLKSGSAYYAPAAAVSQMVETILNDQKKILPISAYLQGEYGLKNVYLGVPAILGKNGVEKIVELKLETEELTFLQNSAKGIKESLKEINW